MRLARGVLLAIILGLGSMAYANEDYQNRLAEVDRKDVDALYQLAKWCKENRLFSNYNKHIREILAIDPNHAPTQELRGFIWNGKRWVHKSKLRPDQLKKLTQQQRPKLAPLARRTPSGPGPNVEDMVWDFSIPTYPDEEKRYVRFIESIIAKMNQQDIFDMEGNWRTLIRPQHRNLSVAKLAEGIMDGSYTDLWGPAMVATTLWGEGDQTSRQQALALFPFLVQQSQQTNNPDSLFAFAAFAAEIGERKAIPQLIALLSSPNDRIQSAARQALSKMTFCPEDQLDLAFAKDWWARHHNSSQATIIGESLGDPNPFIRLDAVRALSTDTWDTRAMATLIRLVEDENPRVLSATAHELKRITGNEWSLTAQSPQEDRQRIADQLREWWQREGTRFVPVALRGKEGMQVHQEPVSQIGQWVKLLSHASESAGATAQIRRKGQEAVADLISVGLSSRDPIVRNRARDLLRELTNQNFGFEGIRGSDEDRAKSLQAWKDWAKSAGL